MRADAAYAAYAAAYAAYAAAGADAGAAYAAYAAAGADAGGKIKKDELKIMAEIVRKQITIKGTK